MKMFNHSRSVKFGLVFVVIIVGNLLCACTVKHTNRRHTPIANLFIFNSGIRRELVRSLVESNQWALQCDWDTAIIELHRRQSLSTWQGQSVLRKCSPFRDCLLLHEDGTSCAPIRWLHILDKLWLVCNSPCARFPLIVYNSKKGKVALNCFTLISKWQALFLFGWLFFIAILHAANTVNYREVCVCTNHWLWAHRFGSRGALFHKLESGASTGQSAWLTFPRCHSAAGTDAQSLCAKRRVNWLSLIPTNFQ